MKFKDIFDKEFITEEHVRKTLKIFYEINLDLYKPSEEPKQEIPQVNQQAPVNNIPSQEVAPAPDTTQPEQPVQNTEVPQQAEPAPENNEQEPKVDTSVALASVVTEDDEVSSTEENRIVRKFEGELDLTDAQKDNIQTFEDVVDALANYKKEGTEILDEFSSEIINLCLTQNFQQLKTDLDKKSKIFVELYYGFKKDDSVGLRFNKHPNSEMLTSTMLVDNEIISAKFSLDKLNQKVAEYRNYYAKKA